MESNDMEFDDVDEAPKSVKDLVAIFNKKNLDHMSRSVCKPKILHQLSERDKSAVKMLNELRQSGCLIPSFGNLSVLLESQDNMSKHI